jgi:hypothetical protein
MIFADRYGSADTREWLLPVESYHPFPAADERGRWEALPSVLREAAIEGAEQYLGFAWPALPATLYMECARTGDRKGYEQPYFARRSALASMVLGECVEGKGRFLDDIVNGLWAICEESTWVVPAHNPDRAEGEPLADTVDHFVDLFAGDTGALLAWVHYLLSAQLDSMSNHVCNRVRREVKSRIVDPFLERSDFWWMGEDSARRLNNWSPWCVSNCLAAALLLEADRGRRTRAVQKSLTILDRFLAQYHSDGGCDEGPGYWTVAGGALLDCLELLHSGSGGKIDVYDEPLIREVARYIHRVHIAGDYYVNFADCNAKLTPPGGLVYRWGQRIGDPVMSEFGSWLHGRRGAAALVRGKLLRALPDLFLADGLEGPGRPPVVRDVWLDGIEVMAARQEEGSDRGLYLAAKGGHNAESHNHNDVGQFIVYADGEPLIIDPGVGTYTAKTFSDQRYEIWTMQSAYHNLPTVNGVQQQEGEEFKASDVAYRADDPPAELSLDIASAYPEAAGIESWRRTCRLVRGDSPCVEIRDELALATPSDDVILSLMTPCRPRVASPGVIELAGPERMWRLAYDSGALTAPVEEMPLDDERLRSSWGDRLFRIELRVKERVERGAWLITLSQ